jgi:hypothetical protein
MIELPDSSSFVRDETTGPETQSLLLGWVKGQTAPRGVAQCFRPLRQMYFELAKLFSYTSVTPMRSPLWNTP